MITPAQIQAVRAWIVAALAEAQAAGEVAVAIPLDRVVYTEQDHPQRALPFVTFRVIADTAGQYTGFVAKGDHGSANVTARTLGTSTVSIQVTSRRDDDDPQPEQEARNYSSALRIRLDSAAAEPLRSANLATRAATLQPNLGFQSRGQWVTRGGVDVSWGVSRLVVDTPGTIQNTEITGTTDPPTPGTVPLVVNG